MRFIMAIALLLLPCGTALGYSLDSFEWGARSGSFHLYVSTYVDAMGSGPVESFMELTVWADNLEDERNVEGIVHISAWVEGEYQNLENPFDFQLGFKRYASGAYEDFFYEVYREYDGQWEFEIPVTFELGRTDILLAFASVEPNFHGGLPRSPEDITSAHLEYGIQITDIVLPEEVPPPVPEPGTFLLFGSALIGLTGVKLRGKIL